MRLSLTAALLAALLACAGTRAGGRGCRRRRPGSSGASCPTCRASSRPPSNPDNTFTCHLSPLWPLSRRWIPARLVPVHLPIDTCVRWHSLRLPLDLSARQPANRLGAAVCAVHGEAPAGTSSSLQSMSVFAVHSSRPERSSLLSPRVLPCPSSPTCSHPLPAPTAPLVA